MPLLVLLSLLAMTAFAAPASAATKTGGDTKKSSAETAKGLEAAKPEETKPEIKLQPLPGANGTYEGHLTVLVKNPGDAAQTFSVEYLQSAGEVWRPSPKKPSGPMTLESPKRNFLAASAPTALAFSFDLERGKAASWLDGTLVLRSEPVKGQQKPQSLVFSVSAAFAPLDEVAPTPTPLTIQITKLWGSSSEASVEIAGAGAPALVGRTPAFSTKALLSDGDGDQVSVTLAKFREENGNVRATLEVPKLSPGEYKGSIPIGNGASAPGLELVIKSRKSVWIFIAIVFVSAVLGGLLPALTKTARRRSLMRLELRGAIERYEKKREEATDDLLWNMDANMGPKPWLRQRWSALPDLDGYAGLYAQLRWARGEDDLDELSPKVAAAIADVSNWIYLYDLVLPLKELAKEEAPTRNGKTWFSTKLFKDTQALLRKARTETPASIEEAKKLGVRCLEQTSWHRAVLKAWTTIAEAEADPDLPQQKRDELSKLKFDDVVDAKPERERTGDETGELAAQLIDIVAAARAIDSDLPAPALARGVAADPAMSVQLEAAYAFNETDLSKPPDRGDASAEGVLKRLGYMDWGVTLIVAFGSVLVYVAPLYSSTWGSCDDLLKAAAAGFGTQAVVQWAALPALQSLRRKAPEAGSPPKKGEDGKEKDEKKPEEQAVAGSS